MTLRTLHVPLDSLLLPAGFLGAALGLGAQNLVRDVVAGLFIVFEGHFAVGDVVRINGTLGTVDQIGLRVTSLVDESGHHFFFPNGAITTIETLPRRHALLLRVPLESLPEGKSREDAVAVVIACIQRFDEDYEALSGVAVLQPTSSTRLLVFRPAGTRSARHAAAREVTGAHRGCAGKRRLRHTKNSGGRRGGNPQCARRLTASPLSRLEVSSAAPRTEVSARLVRWPGTSVRHNERIH
jgi:hypothetical protein